MRLKVKTVVLVGGEKVLGAGVEEDLTSLGITFTRIAGSDRFETNKKLNDTYFPTATSAFYVSGTAFSDALAASSAGALLQIPVVLANAQYSVDTKYTQAFLVGGSAVLADPQNGGNFKRLAGNDRLATSLAVYEHLGQQVPAAIKGTAFADGWKFADALSAVNLVKLGAPVVLATQNSKPQITTQNRDTYVLGALASVAETFR